MPPYSNNVQPYNQYANPASFSPMGYLSLGNLANYVNPSTGSYAGGMLGGRPGAITGGALGGAFSNTPWSGIGGQVGSLAGGMLGNYFGGNAGQQVGSNWGQSIGSTMGGALKGGIQGAYSNIPNNPLSSWWGSQPQQGNNESDVPMNISLPRYARGGQVDQVQNAARRLREMGQGSDKVLAHINPDEAMELEEKYGGDVNPYTGLPQYGLLTDMAKSFAPVFGGGLGEMFGGSQGKILGSLLGGIAGNAGGNRYNMLGGGLGGGAASLLSEYGPSLLSYFTGEGGEENGQRSLGASNIFSGNQRRQENNFESRGNNQQIDTSGNKGFFNKLWGKATDDPMSTILGLTALAGMLGRKETMPKEHTLTDQYNELEKIRERQGLNRGLKDLPKIPARESIEEEEETPFGYTRQYFKNNYAHGGEVGYHLDGDTDGEADQIKAYLGDGEYVIRAPVVSALGNGNNNAGAKQLDRFMGNVMQHTYKAKNKPKAKSIQSYMR